MERGAILGPGGEVSTCIEALGGDGGNGVDATVRDTAGPGRAWGVFARTPAPGAEWAPVELRAGAPAGAAQGARGNCGGGLGGLLALFSQQAAEQRGGRRKFFFLALVN